MPIVVSLSPQLEALLRQRATQQGQHVDVVASELLAWALVQPDAEAAVQGIQRGLDDFEAGRFRPFQDFAQERRVSLGLSPIDECGC
jgi:predicted transcriptional regulator